MQTGVSQGKGRIQKNWSSYQEEAAEASHKHVGKAHQEVPSYGSQLSLNPEMMD